MVNMMIDETPFLSVFSHLVPRFQQKSPHFCSQAVLQVDEIAGRWCSKDLLEVIEWLAYSELFSDGGLVDDGMD